MRSQALLLSTLLPTAYAQGGNGNGGLFQGFKNTLPPQCPTVWKDVATDLMQTFDGCGDVARAAIRAPFHDCSNGPCDGSLILGNECSRSENVGLQPTCDLIQQKATQYNVGVADMIQFAAAIGITTCLNGPHVKALVGRKDNSTAAPEGLVPQSNDSMTKILAQMASVGMSALDTVALIGAHSTGKQFFDDPSRSGASLDSTPGVYDNLFYTQTKFGNAPYSLSSDLRMANDTRTTMHWDAFAIDAGTWSAAFVHAWDRFTTFGSERDKLADCSVYLPLLPGASHKRATMGRPMGYHP